MYGTGFLKSSLSQFTATPSFQLLRPKVCRHCWLFFVVSCPTSHPSGNPIGSTLRTHPEPDQTTSPALHYLSQGLVKGSPCMSPGSAPVPQHVAKGTQLEVNHVEVIALELWSLSFRTPSLQPPQTTFWEGQHNVRYSFVISVKVSFPLQLAKAAVSFHSDCLPWHFPPDGQCWNGWENLGKLTKTWASLSWACIFVCWDIFYVVHHNFHI